MRIVFVLALLVAGACAQGVNDAKSINVPECGQREFSNNMRYSPTSKIVGGQVAEQGDWKWMTMLKNNGGFFCGSSLINSNWLVTAAHCTSGKVASTLSAEIGLHDRNNQANEHWALTRKISRITNHASYSSILMRNDVAVLKLDTPVTYTFYIGPVCIDTMTHPFQATYADKYAMATGWGTLSSGGSVSPVLREVSLRLRTDVHCSAEAGSAIVHTPMMVCAGEKDDGKDTCQGDSGGPLVVPNPNNSGKWTLVGITSWGIGCGNVGVYTRVETYADWILENIQN